MACTTICIWSLIINILLLVIISWFMKKYFEQKKQLKGVIKEFDNDSLEYYLKEIKKRGFDVIIKPDKKKDKK